MEYWYGNTEIKPTGVGLLTWEIKVQICLPSTTLQPFNPSTLQPFNPSTLQPFNPSTLQPFLPSSLLLPPGNIHYPWTETHTMRPIIKGRLNYQYHNPHFPTHTDPVKLSGNYSNCNPQLEKSYLFDTERYTSHLEHKLAPLTTYLLSLLLSSPLSEF